MLAGSEPPWEGFDPEDPGDLVVWAGDADSPAEEAARYRFVLEVVERSADRWPRRYLLVCRAWALCYLTLADEEASVDEALAAVEDSLREGGSCFSVLTAAGMLYMKGRDEDLLRVVRRLPRGCFRGDRFIWRFRIWNLRAAAAFRLGQLGEARVYVDKLVAAMATQTSDDDDLAWEPPIALADTLLERPGPEALALLERLATVDLADWFGDERVARIEASLGRTSRAGTG